MAGCQGKRADDDSLLGVHFAVLMVGAKTFTLLFVEASEVEILKDAELFLHISVSFFPILGLLCICVIQFRE